MTHDWANPLFTDMYQIKMAFAEWKANRHLEPSVFEMFFRKCPFKGKFAIFAGLDEVYNFLKTYKFTKEHIEYLRMMIPQADKSFFDWLESIDCSGITVYGAKDGEMVFPEEPLFRLEGPLALL